MVFHNVLAQISTAYPEAEAKIREQEDKRVVSGSSDSDQPYILQFIEAYRGIDHHSR